MVRLIRCAAIGVLALAVVGVAPAVAQQSVGRIDVTIVDSTGGVLPGVTVNIAGPLNQMMVTDERGEAHFLNLTVGTYQLTANLQGFNEYRNTNVPVAAGVAIPLKVQMAVAGAQETVNVTAESPVIDTKKETTATTVSLQELQDVPTARDPWVVMQSVPGIITDRVNVGGSESGQQSGFMGKGTDSGQTTWNVDGMPITDMSSLSSPFYYDFDMFSEMSVTTGGADVKSSTGGIQLNFMLKSGTNSFHGNARTYYESEGMQSTNLPSEFDYLAGKTGKGDRTGQYVDTGGDIGGPIIKDKWWFWGAYGKTDVRILKLAGPSDKTLLKNVSFKTQGQLTSALRASFTYFNANKLKWGRGAGSHPAAGDDVRSDRPERLLQGRGQLRRREQSLPGRSLRARQGRLLVPAGRRVRQRPGVARRVVRVARVVQQLLHGPAAGRVQHGRELLPREPRVQVRVLLAEDRGALHERVAERLQHLLQLRPRRGPNHDGQRRGPAAV